MFETGNVAEGTSTAALVEAIDWTMNGWTLNADDRPPRHSHDSLHGDRPTSNTSLEDATSDPTPHEFHTEGKDQAEERGFGDTVAMSPKTPTDETKGVYKATEMD